MCYLSVIPDTESSILSLIFHLSFSAYVAVTELQLNRAKEATKSAVLMNLESRVLSFSLPIYIYVCATRERVISVCDLCYVLTLCLHVPESYILIVEHHSSGSLMF